MGRAQKPEDGGSEGGEMAIRWRLIGDVKHPRSRLVYDGMVTPGCAYGRWRMIRAESGIREATMGGSVVDLFGWQCAVANGVAKG